MQCPDPSSWYGEGGAISNLIDIWNLPKRSRMFVLRILQSCVTSMKNNLPYLGLTKRNECPGRPHIILPGSIEEGIVADWMEAGLGFEFTTSMVNEHRTDEVILPVSRSAVMNHFDRMNPVITKVKKCCQANSNNEK